MRTRKLKRPYFNVTTILDPNIYKRARTRNRRLSLCLQRYRQGKVRAINRMN